MIEIRSAFGPLRYRTAWFATRPGTALGLDLIVYRQAACREPRLGFLRKRFHTKLIDVTQADDRLMKGFSKNTAYKINRAEREGVRFDRVNNLLSFIEFHNARSNRGTHLGRRFIDAYGNAVVATSARVGSAVLVMHCYLCDRSCGRVRLLYSDSLLHDARPIDQAMIGRANRFLHYRDMSHFRADGYGIYDLGGYALGTDDEKLRGINRFKDGFGGILAEESDYTSWSFHAARKLLEHARRAERT